MARSRKRRDSQLGLRRKSQQSTGSFSGGAASQVEYFNGHEIHPESEESEDDELPVLPRQSIPDSELSPQYWFLLKVVKYIKVHLDIPEIRYFCF